MARRVVRAVALAIAAAVVSITSPGRAYERQWHVGVGFGYALGGFPGGAVSGFGGGTHLTYGVSDAFNLRLHGDVAAFDLPEPATSAILLSGALGAEYVFDVLEWVPYVGLSAAPVTMLVQGGATRVHLGVELPFGLGYQLDRSWTVGVEGRYRLMLFGDPATSPTHNLLALARLEYAWGF
jgi:hypothetical protein